jgi:hypothetical protein
MGMPWGVHRLYRPVHAGVAMRPVEEFFGGVRAHFLHIQLPVILLIWRPRRDGRS